MKTMAASPGYHGPTVYFSNSPHCDATLGAPHLPGREHG